VAITAPMSHGSPTQLPQNTGPIIQQPAGTQSRSQEPNLSSSSSSVSGILDDAKLASYRKPIVISIGESEPV